MLSHRVRTVLVGLASAGALSAVVPAAEANYRVKGRYDCVNKDGRTRPLAGMKVAIWEDDATNHKITHTFTDSKGRFEKFVDTKKLDADDDDEIFLSLELDTKSGGVQVFNAWDPGTPWNVDTKSKSNGKGGKKTWIVDFGNRKWVSGDDGVPACSVFMGARRAADEFRATTGASAPFGYDVTYQFPAITPFTTTNETRWPADYRTGDEPKNAERDGFETSFHEFAHAFRASFDGSLNHFYADAYKFDYAQTHGSCDENRPEFAFNEGWAEYWSGQLLDCWDGRNLNVEGVVRGRLKVAESCVGRKGMVSVLRSRKIHTFREFQSALAAVNAPCAKKADPDGAEAPAPGNGEPRQAPVQEAGAPAVPQSSSEQDGGGVAPEVSAGRRLTALRGERDRLSGLLAETGTPSRSKSCSGVACIRLAETVSTPAVLRAQIAQLDIAIRYVEQTMDALRVNAFVSTPANEQQVLKLRSDMVRDTGQAALRGLGAAAADLKAAAKENPRLVGGAKRTLGRLNTRSAARGFSKGLPAALLVRVPSSDRV